MGCPHSFLPSFLPFFLPFFLSVFLPFSLPFFLPVSLSSGPPPHEGLMGRVERGFPGAPGKAIICAPSHTNTQDIAGCLHTASGQVKTTGAGLLACAVSMRGIGRRGSVFFIVSASSLFQFKIQRTFQQSLLLTLLTATTRGRPGVPGDIASGPCRNSRRFFRGDAAAGGPTPQTHVGLVRTRWRPSSHRPGCVARPPRRLRERRGSCGDVAALPCLGYKLRGQWRRETKWRGENGVGGGYDGAKKKRNVMAN